MSEESKKFGAQYDANVYSSYRKDTPTELIEKIIAFLKEKVPEPLDTAVDVGCGNGQSTVILSPYFKRVYGSDVSEAQIEQAKASRSLANVTYSAGPAEKLPFPDGSVQLMTAATALHWFDLDTFLPEARRVLCVNGVMAVYGYLNMKPLLEDPARAEEVNELFKEYSKRLEAYHVMSKVSILQNRYKDVKFPFEEVNRCPDVRCAFEGKLPDIVNYVSTWSGYQNFKKADSKGAEELLAYFRKKLYEIGSACNISPEDSTTLYRNFQLILCRKTKDGPFV